MNSEIELIKCINVDSFFFALKCKSLLLDKLFPCTLNNIPYTQVNVIYS